MNLRKTPASSMQKTYDECYLTCSTAIYFEGQNNEAEALRAWRNALDQIYYHNAYKIPSSYNPRTETERALQDSLRSMELQCKERVDLLEALKKSREEALEDGKPGNTNGNTLKPPAAAPVKLRSPKREEPKAWLGNDTTPQTSYEDLPRPLPPRLPSRPTPQSRPSGVRRVSEQDSGRTRSLPHVTSAAAFGGQPPAPVVKERPKPSRTPSPEKKGGMLRTLRNTSGKERTSSGKMPSSLRKAQPAAAQAATQVWSSGQRPSLGPSEPSSSSITTPPNTWDPYTRSLVTSAPPPERSISAQSIVRQPSPSDFIAQHVTKDNLPNQSSYTGAPTRTEQSYFHAYRPNLAPNNDQSSSKAPPVPPHAPTRDALSPPTPAENINGLDIESPADEKKLPLPPSLAQLGQAQSISYMKEYPNHPPAKPRKPPEIAMKKAASLAVSSRNVSPRTMQNNSAPIARKAIGTSRAAGLVSAIAQRRRFDDEQTGPTSPVTSSIAAQIPPVGLSEPGQASLKPIVVEEPFNPNASEQEYDVSSKAWDAKVQNLLKNLPKGVDEAAAKQILNEIVIQGDEVHWADVAGLEIAKSALKETVVYPFLRPDLFMGLREPARGMLLFGPPGTGKTMLARAVATESRSVFFAISASSLTSKFLGESEKLVRALFALAKVMAPSIIFVDEIDSLLGARGGSSEHEATRRIKTEFLIQWSDLQKAAAGRVDEKQKEAGDAMRVLVLAATNLPWAIDEAARRRFVRRQYIPLPEDWVRKEQLRNLLAAQKHSLAEPELNELIKLTDGFSGSDITALAKDAAMGPLRSLGEKLLHMSPDDIRPIGMQDFMASLNNIRPSVSKQGLKEFEDWAREFGERGG